MALVKLNFLRMQVLLSVLLCFSLTSIYAVEMTPDVEELIDELVDEYQFNRVVLEEVLGQAQIKQEIIDLMTRPAERTMTWARYREIFITEKRIREGIEFAIKHRDDLDRATETFSVPHEVIVAIIGVETSYGNIKGSHVVVDALATLGFAYPRRAAFFKDELKQFLILACEEGITPFAGDSACTLSKSSSVPSPVDHIRDLEGSYAGAMGIGQFISSSYRNFAIDFDGDEFRDIWNNETDAIGSVANYFNVHGWKNLTPALLEVHVDPTNTKLVSMANQTLELQHTVPEWREFGVQITGDYPGMKSALHRFETDDGDLYKLGFHDFYVITRYNRSRLYAAVVLELAEHIREGIE
ncbi:MAG: lytic murein transglycosylase [Gammaproteobacteria bacterium]|nr:lytic murein transglycosylase [Gammaproteobacteria bacterium]